MNLQLMYSAVYLLIMMLGNADTKVDGDKIVKDCLISKDPRLKLCKSHLMFMMFDNKNTNVISERIVNVEDFAKFVEACLGSKSKISQL